MKKFLLFMLGALMALPGLAQDFEYTYEGQTLTYTVLDEDAKTCQTKAGDDYGPGNNISGDLVIPAVAKDGDIEYTVTTIGRYAFRWCDGLTSVTIPNSVTTINRYAFASCSGLTSVDIPNSVTTINEGAFSGCIGLTSVDIPNSVTTIDEWAFASCKGLTSVDIPNSVTTINEGAFAYCSSLTSVTIGNSVTTIGSQAFYWCEGLTSMTIPNSVTTIGSQAFEGCEGLKDFTFEDGETTLKIDTDALGFYVENLYMGRNWSYDYKNSKYGRKSFVPKGRNVTIGNTVTELPEYAFHDCYMTSVIIPNSVTTIGSHAFESCSLTSVTIGNSVTTIGDQAFYGCDRLIKSAYPDNLDNPFRAKNRFGEWIDYGLAIGYPANGAIIEDGFVYGPEKETIYFAPLSLEGEYIVPEFVTTIGKNAFSCCSGLTSVTVSSATPPVIDDTSFEGIYATTVLNVPDNAANNYLATGWSLFDNLRIGDITTETYSTGNLKYRLIPAMTTDGKNLALVNRGDYSSLTEVTIPERFTVSENGANTRYYVDGIGYKAFYKCSNLNTVTFNSRNASRIIGDYAFAETKISAITIPETVEVIGNSAFEHCEYITELTIPGSVRTIGDKAFYTWWNSHLETVVFNEGLETIGRSAFSDCNALKELSIPGSVRTIGDYAFSGCRITGDIVLNEGLETIGRGAFQKGSNSYDRSIYIPSTVKSIGQDAFSGFLFRKVNISDLKAWCGIDFANHSANPLYNYNPYNDGSGLYLNDKLVTDLYIPGGVTEIKPYAFYNCEDLNSVTFREGLQSIGEKAFYNAGTLGTITIPGTVTYLGEEAFTASAPTLTFEYGDSPVELAVNSFKAPTSLSWDRPMESLNTGLSSLENLAFGNSVTEIPAAKFKGISSLTSLTLGSGLKTIGDEAFSGCTGLTEVIVPPSVESIGASAFSGNTKQTSIIMGHNVKSIGENAFYECPAQTVSITAQTPPAAPDNTFSNYTGNLYVQGQTAADAYYDADYCWYQFEGHVMIEPTELKVDGEKTLNGKAGDTFQLTATLYPENVTLPQIFWRSTNPEIATVDANGLVTLHDDMSDVMAAAEGDDTSAPCKIIAESLYADGPEAEWTVNNNVGAGIDDVESDGKVTGDIDFNAPVEVYNLQGVMVSRSMDNLATGIYIVRQNNLVKKIAVK